MRTTKLTHTLNFQALSSLLKDFINFFIKENHYLKCKPNYLRS